MSSPSAWQPSSSTNEEGGFSVTARGGPSRINLNWESLISASVHLGEAVTVMNEQRTHLIDADRASLPAPVWRCVGFQARLLLLCSAVTTGQWSMEQTLIGVEAAHEAYREAESSAQRWIDQLTRGSLPAQLWGRLQGDGSDEYDSDRLASSVIQETYGVREAAALFGGFVPMGRQAHTAAMQAEGTLRIAGAGA
ncbi:hypothetical protein [Nesterenkonia pannonica]|uniref:hypothetical protein n=1 Tax=Nesterenkonia pannonica TaxID=1548602 RepID=UPI002164191E|nr:hypothetical protein [Nesterenkonia pannonica]